jgi:hypothetical protein
MICCEVALNGVKLCTAGVGEPGDVHAHVIWVLRHGQFDYSGTPGTADETTGLSVDGQVYSRRELLGWKDANLKVGDEVTIRIIEADAADEPSSREKIDEQKLLDSRRKMYEDLNGILRVPRVCALGDIIDRRVNHRQRVAVGLVRTNGCLGIANLTQVPLRQSAVNYHARVRKLFR